MYSRKEYLESTDCRKQNLARDHVGLDWNYAIAPQIERDLHERLLPFDSSLLMGFMNILTLISCAYFETAKTVLLSLDCDESLTEVKDWLIGALEEADDL